MSRFCGLPEPNMELITRRLFRGLPAAVRWGKPRSLHARVYSNRATTYNTVDSSSDIRHAYRTHSLRESRTENYSCTDSTIMLMSCWQTYNSSLLRHGGRGDSATYYSRPPPPEKGRSRTVLFWLSPCLWVIVITINTRERCGLQNVQLIGYPQNT